MRYIGIILFLFIFSRADADVYWLRDIFKKGSGAKSSYSENTLHWQVSQLLDFKVLYNEPVRINGADGTLEAGLLRYTYFDFLHELIRYESDSIVMTDNNTVINFGNVRYLVYNAGNIMPAICFAFRVPVGPYPSELPFGIPEPGGGAVYEKIVEFPDRGAAYVTFKNIDYSEDAFNNCAAQLRSGGFVHVGGRGDAADRGFFMTPDGSKMVLMSFDEKNHSGFIYKRERKK